MSVQHGFQARETDAPPTAVAVGNFDGVHRGHRALLESTVRAARDIGGEAAAVTFEPHPLCVLHPGRCPPLLTTLEEKCDLISACGIGRVVVLPFTPEMSMWSADTFCGRLMESFDLRCLVVGHDFALGRDRQGDGAFLRSWGTRHGVEVVSVEPVVTDGEAVSSSAVRRALTGGDLARANVLLGHPHVLDGEVEHGDRIGASLGYPTANLSINPSKCLPSRGVYASWLRVGERWHMAATSVGFRPTFGGDHLTVEAFLLDFDGDLYRQSVRAAFISRLREERMYPDSASLVAQIAIDVEDTRRLLEAVPHP